MFIGRHVHTIDEKGRVVLPARIRKEFEGQDSCYIAIGEDGQITLNRPDEYEPNLRRAVAEAKTDKARSAVRLIAQEAVMQKLDKAGRVIVPDHLRQRAGISIPSEVVVSGAVTHAEIWNVERAAADNALGGSVLAKEARDS